MNNIRIEEIQWEQRSEDPIFASPSSLRHFSTTGEYGWLGVFNGCKLAAILPYAVKEKFIWRWMVFTSSLIQLQDISGEEYVLCLNKIVNFVKKNINIDLIGEPPAYAVFPHCPDKCEKAPFGTYVLDLTLDEDTLLMSMNGKHRNVIKKSAKSGVEVRRVSLDDKEEVNRIYDNLKETMDRSSMGFLSKEEWTGFIDSLGNQLALFSVYHNDKLQGSGAFPFSNMSAYYLYGGSCERPFSGAINYMHWEAIKYFKSIGVNQYDFVGGRVSPDKGSKLEGIQRFKSRFGSTFIQGYLWRYDIRPFRAFLFHIVKKLRSGGKGEIIDQEK